VKILVTGAAGYIGSVVTERLVLRGFEVVALDNLCNGHRAAVHPDASFAQGDLTDASWLTSCLQRHAIDAVIHLAAEALIDESIRDPGRFYRANVIGGINLLDAMVTAGVTRLIFSSTAAVYGDPRALPITEDADCAPVSAYGDSKLAIERAIEWYHHAHGLRYVAFRYFNVCGATDERGEWHVPETHLIPLLLEAADGRVGAVRLFGTNFDTPDGTCIRDYIHVIDVAGAHAAALDQIDRVERATYNLGNGAGYSNRQVIEAVRHVTNREVPIVESERRPGDPAQLVASGERVRGELGWMPQIPDIETMIGSAWRWRQLHPGGYET
jgi:UDP-glucose 4-epimerase